MSTKRPKIIRNPKRFFKRSGAPGRRISGVAFRVTGTHYLSRIQMTYRRTADIKNIVLREDGDGIFFSFQIPTPEREIRSKRYKRKSINLRVPFERLSTTVGHYHNVVL